MTGLKQFPEYRASGVDWLGDIPAHWKMVKLKNGFDLRKRPPIKSAGIVTAFRDGQVTLRSNRRIDGYTEGDKQIGYQTIHPGDLVIHAMDAFAGAIGVSDSLGQSTPVYSACTPKSGFNAHFYARALRHIALTGYISSLAKGVRERSTDFRWADAKELPIPQPPIEEQNNIVSFLDRETAQIDAMIGKQERLIELLAEKRQAIITHAVTKGLNSDIPTRSSGASWLGDIPEHWTAPRLAWESAQIVDGTHFTPTYVDEGVPFLRVTDIHSPHIDLDTVARIPPAEHADLIRRCRPQEGDLLLSKNGTIGVPRAVTWEWEFSIFVSLCLIKLRPSVLSGFAEYVFLSSAIKSQIDDGTKQSTVSNLHLEQIRKFRIPLPPLLEQQEIVDYLQARTRKIDRVKNRAQFMVERLLERRSALISAAVTGKIDVREGAA